MTEKICNVCSYVHKFIMCPCSWEHNTLIGHPRYNLATLDDYLTTPQKQFKKDAIEAYLMEDSAGFILTGPTGSGKTHLCHAIAKFEKKFNGKSYTVIGKTSKLPSTGDEQMFDVFSHDVVIIEELNFIEHFEIVRVMVERNKFVFASTNDLNIDGRFKSWRMGVVEAPITPKEIRDRIKRWKRSEWEKWYQWKNPPPISRKEFEDKVADGEIRPDVHTIGFMEPWEAANYLRGLKKNNRNNRKIG